MSSINLSSSVYKLPLQKRQNVSFQGGEVTTGARVFKTFIRESLKTAPAATLGFMVGDIPGAVALGTASKLFLDNIGTYRTLKNPSKYISELNTGKLVLEHIPAGLKKLAGKISDIF